MANRVTVAIYVSVIYDGHSSSFEIDLSTQPYIVAGVVNWFSEHEGGELPTGAALTPGDSTFASVTLVGTILTCVLTPLQMGDPAGTSIGDQVFLLF